MVGSGPRSDMICKEYDLNVQWYGEPPYELDVIPNLYRHTRRFQAKHSILVVRLRERMMVYAQSYGTNMFGTHPPLGSANRTVQWAALTNVRFISSHTAIQPVSSDTIQTWPVVATPNNTSSILP